MRSQIIRSVFPFTVGVLLTLPGGPAWATPPTPPPCTMPSAKITPEGQQVRSEPDFTYTNGAFVQTQVNLNGQPSKGDTFAWTQISGPAVTLSPNSAAQQVSFAAPDVDAGGATLVFQLVASGCGLTSSAQTTIIVTNAYDANSAPVAVATATPAITEEGKDVTLDGSGSHDPDGDTLTYGWLQTSGPAVTLDLSNPAKPTFRAPDVGTTGATLTFQLTVHDSFLASVPPATVTVNVTWVNVPPAAAATCPATVNERETLTLDGSSSSDVDDGIKSYEWTQTSGGPGADLSGQDPTSSKFPFPAPSLVASLGDMMAFRLTVTDNSDASTVANCSVKVLDVTPPVFDPKFIPDITAEAAGPSGAAVTFVVMANDAFDGLIAATCSPSSGAIFNLGDTLVSCTAKDVASNTGSGSFTVHVVDTTPPTLSLPANIAKEATGPSGAAATFSASATDLVDGSVAVTCNPVSGSTFALGANTVNCSSTDAHGNTAKGSFTVHVVDTTPPTLSLPANITKEATAPSGAAATFSASATDLVDGSVAVTCNPVSGSTFALGANTVNCSSTDAHGNTANGSFTVLVVDTTPPVVAPATITAEAAGPGGASVSFTVYGDDLVDGAVLADCLPPAGSFPLGDTEVWCTATDKAGNKGSGSFTVKVVDTTPPEVSVPGNITTGPTQWNGATVTFAPPSAWDLVDLSVHASCDRTSGSVFPFGTSTVTCSATDLHNNSGHGTFTVTVTGFTFLGFFQPVDNLPLVNSVKGGSTVPFKWKLQGQGGVEITDVAAVDAKNLRAVPVACTSAVALDVEVTSTGGTSLRYDYTALQYIFNWQTPKQPGTCWRLDIPFVDGAVRSAQFKLK